MKLVYPLDGHETYESTTFLVGSVAPGQRARVNGEEIRVSVKGSFSWRVPLNVGPNVFRLEALAAGEHVVSEHTLTVNRGEAFPVMDSTVLAVDTETMMPREQTVQSPGQWLQVACLATPGISVKVDIPGVLKEPAPLRPYSGVKLDGQYVDTRQGVFGELHTVRKPLPAEGYYEGSVLIPYDARSARDVPIHFHLFQKDGDSLIQPSASKVSIWAHPKGAVVKGEDGRRAITRTGPSTNAARLTPQLAGTRLVIDGRVGQWLRIRLAQNEVAWIALADIQETPEVWLPRLTVRQITTRKAGANQTEVVIPLRERIPFQVRTSSVGLELSLYGAESHCDVIQYDPEDTLITDISWRQETESRVDVAIQCDRLAGYDYVFEGDALILRLKQMPKTPTEMVIVVDPGHGGAESGTTGPNGLYEKDLNLTVGGHVVAALQREGFSQVHLTRSEDEDVSLETRAGKARELKADLVISLHHNALPDGRDPLKHQGVSLYYYHGFSRELAFELQTHLARALSVNSYGVFYDSLAMTRIHESMAVLVELGFFTHPQEFDRLIEPEFQQKAASTLARTVRQFLKQG